MKNTSVSQRQWKNFFTLKPSFCTTTPATSPATQLTRKSRKMAYTIEETGAR